VTGATVPAAIVWLAGCRWRRSLARVLHTHSGMNTTPSIWVVTWVVLGSLTAALLCFIRVFQLALVP
jgi:hypothetical protein